MRIPLVLLFFNEVFRKEYLSGLGLYQEPRDLFWPYVNLLFSNSTVKLQRADFNLIRYECYQLDNKERHRKSKLDLSITRIQVAQSNTQTSFLNHA